MGMSTHVVGFVPPDDEWECKVAALAACRKAGVEPPEELEIFLGLDPGEGQIPDSNGREIYLDDGNSKAITEWRDEMREGYEIDLAQLAVEQPEVKVVRVYNSW